MDKPVEKIQNVCPICKKAFSRNAHLRRHMLTHTENKPMFPCTLCNELEFSRHDSLFRHQKLCSIKATKKTHSSTVCQKSIGSQIVYPAPYSDPISIAPGTHNSDLLVAVRHGIDKEGTLNGQDILSSIFHSKNAFPQDFSTINLPGLLNAGSSKANSFGEMSMPSLRHYQESPSFQTMPSFLASMGNSPLLPETPFREEYLSYGIKFHMHNVPVLHRSTWDKAHAHPLLKEVLVMRGASYVRITPAQIKVNDDYVLKVLQSDLRDRIFRTFMTISNNDLDLQYELLLAMSLLQGAGAIHKSPSERRITDGYHTMAIMMLRHSGILSHITKWRSSVNLFDLSAGVHEVWKQWIRYESMKRLLVTFYFMDTIRPAMSNLPPELADVELFLPVDDLLWAASTAEGWFIEQKSRDRADVLGPSLTYVITAFLDPKRSIPPLNHFSSYIVIQALQRSIYDYSIVSEHDQYRYQLQQALYRWCRERLTISPTLRLFDSAKFMWVEIQVYRLCLLILGDTRRLSGNVPEENFETLAAWIEEIPDTTAGGFRMKL
ncbi:hypothetical protein M422DRAFT_29475 [Sphaerobolus stellatus SS14]|uniref:C2H2-type domain-containing protein n=1 Tax=Sphaerobolus stellatus (strain SS14) TaxID=990650 RepID=A0A0C9W304_SPHS4|nr:hypothetical protein M422DRAFT_29475 [Sphaerobolus stellatus SS14]